jgi:predicted ATPase
MPRAWGERLLDRISPVFGREEQLKRLEDALEDASDPNQPKQIVLLYGHSGLSKCKLVEMAFGVLDQPQMGGHHRLSSDNPSNGKCSSGERRSGITQSTSASSGGINHPPQQQHYPSRRQAPCPCWYGFGKFTKEQEDKPFAELSRSIAEIVTRQLIPECQRESGAADTATVESNASGNSSDTKLTSSPQLYDIKKLLRERLLVSEVDALIKFCPEVEQLHLFSARERAAEQTKRAAKAAKNSAMVLSDLVGRGLAGVAPSYFSAPSAGLISSINSDKSRASTNGHVAPRGSPFNKLERLKYVVKVFFRTLSEVRPLVWVLDDLQYATKDGLSSLSFIESLLDDSKLKRFLFCGVVRDDEKTMKETKALRQWLDSLPSVLELRMEHMDEKNVEAMLWNLLRVEGDDLEQLASLIYQRTHGNDYFVFEMINYLQQEGVITFSTQTYQWEFDIDEVKRKTMVSENVLSFVGRRLQQLPMPVQRYLKLAAFLGYRFDEDLLARIARANFVQSHNDMKENEAEIHELLQMAVDEGFIERLSYPNVIRYKFVHVEIQTECERLIKEKGGAMSAEKLHWNIGAALWRGWRRLESYGNIENRVLFPCVKELNAGRSAYKPRKATFYQLARLNHEAAKRSFELHAYFPAASYLQTAINLMGRCAWNDNYHLCLELHTFLAQMYLASGQLNRIPKIVRVVGEHVESFQDRLPVDLVELARCKMLGDIDMHIQKSISLLNLLGVSLSGDYFWFQTERKKRRVKGTLISLSDEEIQARTQASGSTDSTTIEQIEQELIHTLVFSVESKVYLEKEYPNLETAVAIKMIESFLNEQNGPNSGALCLTLAACLFCETDNDQKFFRKLLKWLSFSKDQADLAFSIRLAELALKVPSTENELQTMAVIALVRHWRYPLPNCAELMLKSYNVGMQR